jgi:hypothetical protein
MGSDKRRDKTDAYESKTRERLRQLVNLEAIVMAGDPHEVEQRIRQMAYGHRNRL